MSGSDRLQRLTDHNAEPQESNPTPAPPSGNNRPQRLTDHNAEPQESNPASLPGSDRLQRLSDHSAIRDLAVRYCAAVDRRDWDLLSRLFLPGATVGVPQSDPMRGTDEIVARYRRGLSKYDATHHMVTNHEIAVEGDSARHSCLVHAQHVRPDASASAAFTIGGRYEDELVRTPHGWKFKHRELVTVWTEGSSAR